jgi:hypothetical protein
MNRGIAPARQAKAMMPLPSTTLPSAVWGDIAVKYPQPYVCSPVR